MAVREQFQVVKEFPAAGDLSAKQFLFMEVTTGKVDTTDAITDIPVGVLQNKPDAEDKHAEVLVLGGTKLIASAAITQGALIGVTATGKAVAVVAGTDTTAYIVGRALEAASGDGILFSAYVDCIAPARAQ